VVEGNGPGLVWWAGVPANSTTGAIDQTHLAHTGTILWSGIPARSRDATISGPICDPGLTLTVPSPGLELTTTCGFVRGLGVPVGGPHLPDRHPQGRGAGRYGRHAA
jgi:hypothetical protein